MDPVIRPLGYAIPAIAFLALWWVFADVFGLLWGGLLGWAPAAIIALAVRIMIFSPWTYVAAIVMACLSASMR